MTRSDGGSVANPRYRDFDRVSDSGMPPKAKPGHRPESMPERTAAWPGLPGKSQPRERSGGTKKCRQSAKQEGL